MYLLLFPLVLDLPQYHLCYQVRCCTAPPAKTLCGDWIPESYVCAARGAKTVYCEELFHLQCVILFQFLCMLTKKKNNTLIKQMQ